MAKKTRKKKRSTSQERSREPGWPPNLYRRGDARTFRFERHVNGEAIRLSLGRNVNQAIHKAMEINNAIDRGDFAPERFRNHSEKVGTLLYDALERRKSEAGLLEKSVASFQSRIRHFMYYLEAEHPGVIRASQVTPEVARGFVPWRRSQLVSRSGKAKEGTPRNNPAARTVADDVQRLRTLFAQAIAAGRLSLNPFDGVRVPKRAKEGRGIPRSLTPAQASKLLKAARAYDDAPIGPGRPSTFRGMMHDIIRFFLLTGLRKDELVHLAWVNVDLDWENQGLVRIRPLRQPVVLRVHISGNTAKALDKLAERRAGAPKLFRSTSELGSRVPRNYIKAYEPELLALNPDAWSKETGILSVPATIEWEQKATQGDVPLVPPAREILWKRWKLRENGSPFVFPHPDGGPLKSDMLAQFKPILADAGLDPAIRIHDLRHTFAMTLRQRGVPIETIMGLMRHKDIRETMVYAQYSLDEGAKAVRVLRSVFR